MNRIFIPLLAIGMALVAFASFLTVSLIGLVGIGIYGLVRATSQLTTRFSGYREPGNRGDTARTRNQTNGINRIWNDGRGTIIDM